ncbi:MAG: hypothetical protein PHF97_07255 [Bacteroidales bacterium]|nr:hypothetical protein [Bacteroidales bacterium]
MLIYLFRITSEEHDNFLREIEIQPNQTFLDFHICIAESAELLPVDRASFFITDKKYKKDKEIALKPEKKQIRKYDEDMDQVVTETITIPLMKNSKVKNYIEDPHQKLIYECSGKDQFTFYIELFRILQSDGIPSYPRCVKHSGTLPKKLEQPLPIPTKPSPPKIMVPKIPLPKIEPPVKFDEIVEDVDEIAEIEIQLGALDEPNDTPDIEVPGSVQEEEEDSFSFEEEEKMDHLEDYEDIDNLDKRYSAMDSESDEF